MKTCRNTQKLHHHQTLKTSVGCTMTTWSEYTIDPYDRYSCHSAYKGARLALNSLDYESQDTNRLVTHTLRKYNMTSEVPPHDMTYGNLGQERLGSDYKSLIRRDATTVYIHKMTAHYSRQEQQYNHERYQDPRNPHNVRENYTTWQIYNTEDGVHHVWQLNQSSLHTTSRKTECQSFRLTTRSSVQKDLSESPQDSRRSLHS